MLKRKHVQFWLLILMLIGSTAIAQVSPTGTTKESQSMKSNILGQEVKYSIYLPADYEAGTRKYPVVYLLHGYTDDETSWIQFGEANSIAGKAIANGTIPPMIIVMPDAGVTWYVNDYLNKKRYEDMFINELIPFIDSTYRTRPKKEFRGISGLSMGGHGALLYAMHHPDLFTACAAFSSAIFSDEYLANMPDKDYNRTFAELFSGNVTGKARLTDTWHKNSTLELAKTLPEETLKKVRWYFDCGDQDFLYEGNALMHITLRKRKIQHEFRMRAGTHQWSYWRDGLIPALQFIGQSFNR
ncbi:alpha/beta hydrolase [Flavihumibacter fluvii]|uniref:alpha/beta hydrolase n=1 Tax=Flavihumibacter fluvii TaxID=2838157 RepID=UPI001BDDD210|nr:alpha/beta hydrolase family protein [Flavihumibacter fluvii]ULQ52732.1 esterase family protein [Flavihumibacter fluvii]